VILQNAIDKARSEGAYAELVKAIPYAAHLGVKMTQQADGLLFELPFREPLVGNHLLPAIHGGVVAGFMENSAMLHLLVNQEQGRLPKTVDFAIDYLRSAGPKTTYARCDVTRQGRRVAHVQISCWQDNPCKPVAVARVHFILEEAEELAEGSDASPL